MSHFFPVKKYVLSTGNEPSLSQDQSLISVPPLPALAIGCSRASQRVEYGEGVFYFGGTSMNRVRNITTSHHYFYPRT